MYTKLPIMMMKKNDYTEISEDHPGGYGKGQDSVGSSAVVARDRRNRNRFWDAGSFCRSWPLMKVVMLAMVVLLLGIIVFQGVEEHDSNERQQEWLEEQEYKQTAALRSSAGSNSNHNPNQATNDDQSNEINININSNAYSNSNSNSNSNKQPDTIPMPSGVNLGSWLSLEDYFFAGQHNSVEVATPGQLDTASRIAACLPPLHVGSTTGPKWHSETDLFRSLMDGHGVEHAVRVFASHRTSFIDLTTDLETIASLGVTTVRVPMNWCWTDHDPRTTDLSSLTDQEMLEQFACEDPFFPNGSEVKPKTATGNNDDNSDNDNDNDNTPMLWPAIPKALIEDLLRACARAGIKASLDVHTYPGGTSIGTFSGVWPNWPRFWTHGGDGVEDNNMDSGININITTAGFDIGHKLFGNLVAWMEDLSVRDPLAFSGLRGLSPMNEPAHLAGIFEVNATEQFLPPLPPALAGDFMGRLRSSFNDNDNNIEFNTNTTTAATNNPFPDGQHLRVMYWFQRTLELFRKSKLPSLGIEMQANIIESIFPMLGNDDDSEDVEGELRIEAIAKWWCADGSSVHDDDDSDSNVNVNVNVDNDNDNDNDNDSRTKTTKTKTTAGLTTTSAHERSSWAVLDIHHYHAWSEICSGTVDGQDSAYVCGDVDKRTEVLQSCTLWAQTYRDTIDRVCGVPGSTGTDTAGSTTIPLSSIGTAGSSGNDETTTATAATKLMSAEFSASSHHSVRRSCNDLGGLKDSYVRQVQTAEAADVELFYWSYQMPYGGTFRRAWSFKELMYNLGVTSRPDEPQFDCDSNLVFDPEIPP